MSELARPMLNLDTIDAFRSMADGRMYDSKSAYRKDLRARGLIEIGNEIDAHMKQATSHNPKPPAKADIIAAYQKVKQGYKPPPAPMVEAIDKPDLD